MIPSFIRERVIAFLVSKAGGILVTLINAGIAAAVTKLAALVPGVAAQIDQAAVAAFVWALLMAAVNYATNHWLTKDAKTIQAALVRQGSALEIDGWIGDKTVQALIKETGLPVQRAIPVQASGQDAR